MRLALGLCIALVVCLVASGRAGAASWQIVGAPIGGVLDGVSCTSASACTAVGYQGSGGRGTVLAERWNGVVWAVQPVTPPAGGQSKWTRVSCGSARFCVAIGMLVFSSNFSGFYRPIRGMWNGSRWSVQMLPKHTVANDVSCTSPRFCVMTGAPTERWNGSRWSVMAQTGHVPPAGPISCLSSKWCTALDGRISARWNGKAWSAMGRMAVDVGGQGAFAFSAVACASQRLCVAAGWESIGGDANSTSLVDLWTGARWSTQSASVPYGVGIEGVGCSALVGCPIVGEITPYTITGPPLSSTFAEFATSTGWVVEPTPNLQTGPFAQQDIFFGASCAANTCVAVGDGSGLSGQPQTLIEQYL